MEFCSAGVAQGCGRVGARGAIDAASPAADDGAEVRDAIARLEPDLAELVRLVHWERFTIAEAAVVLGVPASTARGRYAKAKDALRAALGVGAPAPGR